MCDIQNDEVANAVLCVKAKRRQCRVDNMLPVDLSSLWGDSTIDDVCHNLFVASIISSYNVLSWREREVIIIPCREAFL